MIRSALSIISLFCIFSIPFGTLTAQIIPEPDHDAENDIQVSILPVLGYSSDTSLVGGGLFRRLNYGNFNDSPFLSDMRIDLTASLRGELLGGISYDRTRTFGSEIRSSMDFLVYRSKTSHYFGIGNNVPFEEDLYSEDYYLFEVRQADLMYRGRKTLAKYGFDGNFDLFADLNVTYLEALVTDEASMFAEEFESGTGGWSNQLGLGFIADDRDSEFAPTEGYRYEVGTQFSHSVFGSDYNFSRYWVEMRHYLQLFDRIVLAQKIEGRHTIGDAPFWGLTTLGDEYGLRGFHLNRFRGDSSILHILEARTWLFSVWDDGIRFGGQLFWDTGRVFSDFDSAGFFDNWKQTYGFGGAISLFGPDMIIRGDVGFSPEATRIYAGVGYIF